MKMKQCGKKSCRKWKPVSEFYKHRSTNDGLSCYCAECIKKATKDNWENGTGKEYDRKYKRDNRKKINALRRAKPKTEEQKRQKREYEKNRRKDPLYRTQQNLRRSIWGLCKPYLPLDTRRKKSVDIFKVDWKTALEHLGPNKKGTHIDHVIPIKLAKTWHDPLAAVEALNCIWNLRRIPASKNLIKGDRLPEPNEIDIRLFCDAPLAIEIYVKNKYKM